MSLPKLNNKGSSTVWDLENPNNEDVDSYLESFPPGFRFKPNDYELVVRYLKPKLFNKPLPPNKIRDVDLYHYNPETLAGICIDMNGSYGEVAADMNGTYGEGEWYFFTPRDKKYKNGSRPRRAAGNGYWKATGADRTIQSNGVEVGYRKALVFYKGKPPKGDKTDWMMHEYRLKDPPARLKPSPNSIHNDMRLDDWVLCKIYKKNEKYIKAAKRQCEENEDEQVDNLINVPPLQSSVKEADNSFIPYQQQEFNFGGEMEGYFGDNMINGFVDAASLKYNYYNHDPAVYNCVSDIYDRNFEPEILGLPSAMPPMDTIDQYINDIQDEKLPHFKFDHLNYP